MRRANDWDVATNHRPSLPDAESPEHLIQHVLDIHAPGDPAKRISGLTQILGTKLHIVWRAIEKRLEIVPAGLNEPPVTDLRECGFRMVTDPL